MSYHADAGEPDTRVTLIGCATCGGAFRYPTEITLCSDSMYRCLDGIDGVGCFDNVNKLDDARLRALPIPEEKRFLVPGAALPNGR